jgi:aminomethyltransferase
MVDFAGWSMPVQYASIVDEHLATRRAAGLFDVSHMGRLAVTGPAAIDWLEGLLTRKVAGIEPGQLRYTLVTGIPAGGTEAVILDDAIVSRDADAADGTPRLGLVVNASNRARVVAWLTAQLPPTGVALNDRTFETAMIAVQGPRAVELVCGLCPVADAERINALRPYRATSARIAGEAAALSRSGYTGEDGVEIVVAADAAESVWKALCAAGAVPCGLGARDTLRLEAGMPLFGHELREGSDPFAIGLGLGVTLDGRSFPGCDRFLTLREHPTGPIRVGLVFDSKRAAREGSTVWQGDREIGVVTSGSFAPTVGQAVAMAMLDRSAAAPGTTVDVLVRDTKQPARVTPLPFYRRG